MSPDPKFDGVLSEFCRKLERQIDTHFLGHIVELETGHIGPCNDLLAEVASNINAQR